MMNVFIGVVKEAKMDVGLMHRCCIIFAFVWPWCRGWREEKGLEVQSPEEGRSAVFSSSSNAFQKSSRPVTDILIIHVSLVNTISNMKLTYLQAC